MRRRLGANGSLQNKKMEIDLGKTITAVIPSELDLINNVNRLRLSKLDLLPSKGLLILDAACGPGSYGLLLSEGNEVIGVDISTAEIKIAHARAKSKRLTSDFMPIVADLENLPLRENIFDVCFIGWALHHFPSMAVISYFHRVLKDNGVLALAEPNEINPTLVLSRYVETIFEDLLRETGQFTKNVSVHSYKEYCERIMLEGFKLTKLQSCYYGGRAIIPYDVAFAKKILFYINFKLRDILCALPYNISKSFLTGTDLLIIAHKK